MYNFQRLLFKVLVLSLATVLVACSSFYGLKKLREYSPETIRETAERYHIPPERSYVLDTAYFTFIRKLYGNDTLQVKNHLQPLQVLYFDKSERLISHHLNCYARGFPNLKWNRDGLFDSFPAVTQIPADSMLTFGNLLRFIRPAGDWTVKPTVSDKEYYVVVFWDIFMGRQSKRLIERVNENLLLSDGQQVEVLFVNNDGLFVHLLSD